MADIQCEHCGWIGDESLYTPAAPKGTSDLICPACQQVIEGLEVDWKERHDAAEAELAEVRHDLAAAVDRVIAANERADKLAAEVEQWRRAVRWFGAGDCYALRVHGPKGNGMELAAVWPYRNGWHRQCAGVNFIDSTDRNTACTKVCELLGIPVVLPVGGE
jgi:uncharacterized Zn finger protein (UPF0148 family)